MSFLEHPTVYFPPIKVALYQNESFLIHHANKNKLLDFKSNLYYQIRVNFLNQKGVQSDISGTIFFTARDLSESGENQSKADVSPHQKNADGWTSTHFDEKDILFLKYINNLYLRIIKKTDLGSQHQKETLCR